MNHPHRTFLAFLLLNALFFVPARAQHKTIVVDSSVTLIEGTVAPYNTLQGGDTLCFSAGKYDYLLIRNISGEPGNPVIMINFNGEVIIDTDHHFGISIENCRYFRLTGTGTSNELYGIRIEGVTNGGGIGIGHGSSDYEIDHLYIANISIGGMYAKTDPDCSFKYTREKFTQFNTRIHDNYITNIGNEGLYVGNTKYFGQTVNCSSSDTLLMPSLLDGVFIYNNILNITGWDGIQVSSASNNCHIYDNMVLYDSQTENFGQMSGIIIGGGSKCDCYNNYIAYGKGNGIESHGLGGYRIFNNVIVDAGKTFRPNDTLQMKYGIYMTDLTVQQDSSFSIIFNDIINPKSDGIRFTGTKSRHNRIYSNVIINPGTFDYYENGHFNFKGKDAFVMIPDSASDVTLQNNFFSRTPDDAGFAGSSLSPLPGSPLIDAAYSDNLGISFDFYHHNRPYNALYDIGAFEFDPAFLSADDFHKTISKIPVLSPNPVRTKLSISCISASREPVTLWIIDLQGHLRLKKITEPDRQGVMKVEADLRGIPDGSYIYRVQVENRIYSGKFVKAQ